MSITFETNEPNRLLMAFKKAIDDKKVVTWSYDSEDDFTHTPNQWQYKAWLRPKVYQGKLTMIILGRKEEKMPLEVYSVYHGRFIESMIDHCRSLFTIGSATALPTTSDNARVA